MKIRALVLVCLLTTASAAAEEPLEYTPAIQQKLEKAVQTVVSSKASSSVSVAVVRRGRLVFSYATGTADLEHKVAATTRTR